TIHCEGAAHDALASLGKDLKFVFITSQVLLAKGRLQVDVKTSAATKCNRCWHYSEDVGQHTDHPSLCGRCISNLHGPGEVRHHA
ncbi:MAG: hypothetical protein EBT70_16770, partial [Betaproteobacteria bacterium]|nr:hypothetical protein [Betaproteobacteria bacterium]